MAVVAPSLNVELMDIFKKSKKSGKPITPPKLAKAIVTTYMQTAQNTMGFPVTQISGSSGFKSDLEDIMKKPKKAGKVITPMKLAKAIVNVTNTVMTQHQTTIVANAGFTQLKSDLESAMSKATKNPTKFPQALTKAIDTYFKSCNISGVIPGSPPVPFSGTPI
tara:strand:- start:1280 stop:1771 length:492 start_codon:yes stop_codon:yes gene_type:complete